MAYIRQANDTPPVLFFSVWDVPRPMRRGGKHLVKSVRVPPVELRCQLQMLTQARTESRPFGKCLLHGSNPLTAPALTQDRGFAAALATRVRFSYPSVWVSCATRPR